MSEPQEAARPIDCGGTPWGPWSTVGFGVLVVSIWLVVQLIAILVLGWNAQAADALSQGWIIARALIVSAPIPIGAALLLARTRKGIRVAEYLGLSWPPARQALGWSFVFLVFLVTSDALSLALGGPLVPDPMMPIYRAGSLPIFLFGIVVAAPLAEEFLFRGFVQTGLVNSRLRPLGAIVLTALACGILHLQYDAYGIATVAGTGILLGLIRWRTGSLWLCALLHGLANALGSAEAMFILGRE